MRSKTAAVAVFAAVLMTPGIGLAQGMGMPAPPDINPVSKKPAILSKVGIDQRIGNTIPLNLTFRDDAGRSVRLADYFGKRPVVMALAYYECPMLCTQVLNGMVHALRPLDFEPGRDYDVVVVSINPRETPGLAAQKKATYVADYGRPDTASGWHFLTGDEASIQALAAAIGFRYAYDENIQQYAHGAAIYVLTPQGRLAQYFYGIEFPSRDLRLAMVESSHGKLGSVVDQVLLLCYHYDPTTGKYGAAIMDAVRIGGVLTLLALGGFLFVSLRRDRRTEAEAGNHI